MTFTMLQVLWTKAVGPTAEMGIFLLFTCNQQRVYAKQFLAQIKVFFRNRLNVICVRGEITIFA